MAKQTKGKKQSDYKSKKFVSAVRSIAMGTQETKQVVNSNQANHFHNGGVLHTGRPGLMINNLLATQQGIGDTKNTNKNRIGDTILPVGVKIMFQVVQPADRPNVSYKVWIVKHTSSTSPVSLATNPATNNLMLDSIDTERANPQLIKVFRFSGASYWTGDPGNSKEVCFHRKLWMKLPKKQYVYNGDNSESGKEYNLSVYVGAYDTAGTLVTDVICSSTITSVLYFKDA